MGSVDRRPNGRWRARYRDPDGRMRSQTFDRKGDAERFLQRNGAELQRGEWIDPALRRVAFSEWAALWWQTTVRLRPTTRRGYWQILNNHVLPTFGGRALASIDYMDVERFIAEKLTEGKLGPKKVRDCVSVVSLVMQAAVRSGARRDNPAAGHHVTVRRRRVRQGDILDMGQIHALIAEVRDPYKPAVWLLVLTGMRPAELCGRMVNALLGRHVRFVLPQLGRSLPDPPLAGDPRSRRRALPESAGRRYARVRPAGTPGRSCPQRRREPGTRGGCPLGRYGSRWSP